MPNGAYADRRSGTWRSVVERHGVSYYLGSYGTEAEAAAASAGFRSAFDILMPSARRKPRGPYKKRPPEDRFWALVEKQPGPDGCWLWTGKCNENGYGYFRDERGRDRRAHLWLNPNPSPGELEADHLCRVRNCVRPEHIEFVTHIENIRRRST